MCTGIVSEKERRAGEGSPRRRRRGLLSRPQVFASRREEVADVLAFGRERGWWPAMELHARDADQLGTA